MIAPTAQWTHRLNPGGLARASQKRGCAELFDLGLKAGPVIGFFVTGVPGNREPRGPTLIFDTELQNQAEVNDSRLCVLRLGEDDAKFISQNRDAPAGRVIRGGGVFIREVPRPHFYIKTPKEFSLLFRCNWGSRSPDGYFSWGRQPEGVEHTPNRQWNDGTSVARRGPNYGPR